MPALPVPLPLACLLVLCAFLTSSTTATLTVGHRPHLRWRSSIPFLSRQTPVYQPPSLIHLGPPVYSLAFLPPDAHSTITPPFIPHNASALNITSSTPSSFIPTDLTNPLHFRYALTADTIKYTAQLPQDVAPGSYLIRLGLQDPSDPADSTTCARRVRYFRARANYVYSKYVDPAEAVGCHKPFYVDLNITIWKAREIHITMFKLPKFLQPSISNFQLYQLPGPTTTTTSPPSSNNGGGSGTTAPNAPPPVEPLAPPPELPDSVAYDAGAAGVPVPAGAAAVPIDTTLLDARTLSPLDGTNIPVTAYDTSLQGDTFSLEFPLAAGTYDVTLAFVETTACDPDSDADDRVFSVSFNENIRLESYNIYQVANGCGKAVREVFLRQIIDALAWRPFMIHFRGIANKAMISYVLITPSSNPCTPVTSNAEILDDHLAHAVPGRYPPSGASSYVDVTGRGYVDVTLDASGSHTHFSYPGGIGKIISYEWSDPETGKIISTEPSFNHRFYLGSTRFRLTVTDNACTRDEAETTITVSGSMRKGQYCYYYTIQPSLPDVGTLDRWPRPMFAAPARSTRLKFPKFLFDHTRFVARCQFFVDFKTSESDTVFSIHTGKSGLARVYRGTELLIDSETSTSSGPVAVSAGITAFEVLYQREDLLRKPKLFFKVNGKIPKAVSYDMSTVMPIITSVFPNSGTVAGGSRVKVNGFGLPDAGRVFFGSVSRRVQTTSASSTQVFVVAPPAAAGREKYVPIYVQSQAGVRSNRLTWEYSDACDNVRFEKRKLRMPRNAEGEITHVPIDKPTSITTWVDGSLFVGQRNGRLRRVIYNIDTLLVESVCTSEPIRNEKYVDENGTLSTRTILGVTFDPRDGTTPRPYVSVSTLFWRQQKQIDETASQGYAWSNGEVLRMQLIDPALSPSPTASVSPTASNTPAIPSPSPTMGDVAASEPLLYDDPAASEPVCLSVESTIVTGLPVADNDHSVNELLFTDDGDLLIAVGGWTNAGLPNRKLAGKWDSFYSGAVLIARLSRGLAFNGNIPYTNPESYILAQPVPGYDDVDFYATGTRNLFSLQMSRSGRIYGVDMGPNCEFGNVSSSCDQLDPSLYTKRHWIPTFPGQVIADRTRNARNCSYGPSRDDKILHIQQDRFYGHPNLVRGLYTSHEWQCAWVDPLKGKAPGKKRAPWNYVDPVALVPSAKTGLVHYGGNAFCGKLRNDLIMSANTENGIWRLRLDADGKADGSAFKFQPLGGIRVVENVRGDLLFPLYNSNMGVHVARPKTSAATTLEVINALPFRHGREGGGVLHVAGWGFGSDVAEIAVSIGSETCVVVSVVDNRILCTVPAYMDGDRTKDVTVTVQDGTATLQDAVLYMAV